MPEETKDEMNACEQIARSIEGHYNRSRLDHQIASLAQASRILNRLGDETGNDTLYEIANNLNHVSGEYEKLIKHFCGFMDVYERVKR